MSTATASDQERVALVTGCTGGIGRAIAESLIADGYLVVIHHVHDHAGAQQLRLKLGTERTLVVEADLRSGHQVKDLVNRISQEFGRLNLIVNNAGVMEQVDFASLTEELWSDIIEVNLTGAFRVLHAGLDLLRSSSDPSIVNISSQGAYLGLANAVAYSASKAGLLGLTRALAREIGPGVRVNAVAPGPIETPMTEAHATPEWIAEKTSKLVMARFGRPQEVAAVVRFLASADASYITGQTILVNGGGAMT